MASGASKFATGKVKGTGANLDVKLDFRPRHVRVHNTATGLSLEWQESMNDGEAAKAIAAGDRTFITSAGITPLTKGVAGATVTGFRIGTDATNGSGNDLHFIASE